MDPVQLVHEHRHALRQLFFRKGIPSHAHDDVLQELRIRLFRTLQNGGLAHTDNVFGYVYRAAINCIIRWRRKTGRYQFDTGAETIGSYRPDIEGDIDRADMLNKALRIIRTLPPDERSAIEHVAFGGVLSDLARENEVSRGTIGRTLHQARQQIKEQLKRA